MFGFISSLLNYGSQQSTNQMNYKINKENNELNYKMWQENIQNQWDMWNATNAYNDPAAVKQRKLDAGFNPYVDDSNGGTATSQSMPAPPQMQAFQSQAPVIDGSQISAEFGQLVSALTEMKLKNEQAKGISMDNDFKRVNQYLTAMETLERIGNTKAKTQGERMRNQFQGFLNKIQQSTLQDDINYRKNEVMLQGQLFDLNNIEKESRSILNQINRTELATLGDRRKQELSKLLAETMLDSAKLGLTFHQARLEANKVIESELSQQRMRNENSLFGIQSESAKLGLRNQKRQYKYDLFSDSYRLSEQKYNALLKEWEYNIFPYERGGRLGLEVGKTIGSFIPGR